MFSYRYPYGREREKKDEYLYVKWGGARETKPHSVFHVKIWQIVGCGYVWCSALQAALYRYTTISVDIYIER